MKTPSVPALKKWAKENKSLAHTVLTATVFAEMERERVDAYVAPIFARYEFKDEDTGAVLTNPAKAYLAGDDPRFPAYYAELDAAHVEHGWKGEGDGTCPALVAESLKIEAENLLLASLAEFLGINECQNTFTFSSSHGGPLETRAWAIKHALTCCLGKMT